MIKQESNSSVLNHKNGLKINDKDKKPLNCENTFKSRICQNTLAANYRKESSIRNDVEQTTDLAALNEMFEYIKSDTETLDTHKDSKVATFYAGRSIFITGASGFVGKVSLLFEEDL